MAKLGMGARKRVRVVRRRATKKALTVTQKKAVTAIAKKAVSATVETKYFNYATSVSPVAGTPVSYNLFYHGVTRGIGQNQLVGDKLRWKGIAIKYNILNAELSGGVLVYYRQPIIIDLYILRANVYKALTSLALTDIATSTSSDPNLFYVDPQIGKVLYKKTVIITPQIDGTTVPRMNRQGKIWLKRSQMIKYKDFSSSYDLADTNNYYFMVVNRSPSNPTGATDKPYMAFSYQNYFTDS